MLSTSTQPKAELVGKMAVVCCIAKEVEKSKISCVTL